MIYKYNYKILFYLFILFFYSIFNEIKNEKIYMKKYYQLNTKKYIVKQNGQNYNKYNIEYIKKIKKVVYSIIIGKYDNISTFNKQEGFNYFLFSDIKYHGTNWTIISIPKLIEKVNVSNIKLTRYFKLFPHLFFKDYELSIYIDASYIIKGDLNELLLKTLNPSFNLYILQHPYRNKVFQEFVAVIKFKKDTKKSVNKVKKKYIKEKFPDNLGLTQNCLIIRNHNNKIIIKLSYLLYVIYKYKYFYNLRLELYNIKSPLNSESKLNYY